MGSPTPFTRLYRSRIVSFRPGMTGSLKVPKKGNTLIVQLVISAMKHQPCPLTFFDTRDAIPGIDWWGKLLHGIQNFCFLSLSLASDDVNVQPAVEDRQAPEAASNAPPL
ncbi:hypothetical protein JOM56_009611 [Amanita muscaria]